MRELPNGMPPPILITGCARSGTSMVAGAINMCGAYGGNMSGPNKNNAKGMFENIGIRNGITKPYLRDMGADALGQFPLPDVDKIAIPVDWRKRVEQVIVDDGYQRGPWMYKGAKMGLFWPVWAHAFPDAKWVIVRRKPSDIINSCMKTSFMRAFQKPAFQKAVGVDSEEDGWLWWVHQHERLFVDMIQAGLNIKIVWPERMVNGDYRQLMETMEWLGLPWKSGVLSFVDPKLWKARNK